MVTYWGLGLQLLLLVAAYALTQGLIRARTNVSPLLWVAQCLLSLIVVSAAAAVGLTETAVAKWASFLAMLFAAYFVRAVWRQIAQQPE